jgi:hypothetical protein
VFQVTVFIDLPGTAKRFPHFAQCGPEGVRIRTWVQSTLDQLVLMLKLRPVSDALACVPMRHQWWDLEIGGCLVGGLLETGTLRERVPR